MQFGGKVLVYKNSATQNIQNFEVFYEAKAPGIDKLFRIFLKDSATLLTTPITQSCYLSFYIGTFCDACKIVKLKPHFKHGSKTNTRNYGPISIPPTESKVLERVIHEQTIEFLDKHKNLYKFQPGFQKNNYTYFCLTYLTDKIWNSSGLLTGMDCYY